MLPLRALQFIREYSKPMTRPDWRTFKRSISWSIYMNEIDALYKFKRACALFKLVHANMHLHIDMRLYDMTQEELDAFINYRDHKNNEILYKFLYIIIYSGTLYASYRAGYEIINLRSNFINNRYTNNVLLDNFIYVNIYLGCLYTAYQIGDKLGQMIDSF